MREAHKRNRNPKYKQKYRVKNWSQYDKALRNRGDITIWFSREAIKAWTPKPKGKKGSNQIYSDLAIETVLTLRLLFHLPLRQAKGFVMSILSIMKIKLPTPDHSTVSRRSRGLKAIMNCRQQPGKPLHLIVDSTGLSIHGEGPWSRHKHGRKGRRGWRKLHIMVDKDGKILAASMSKGFSRDASQIPRLLGDIDKPFSSFTGDRGYDEGSVYRTVLKHSPRAAIVVPPRMRSTRQQERTSGFNGTCTSIESRQMGSTSGEKSPAITGRAG